MATLSARSRKDQDPRVNRLDPSSARRLAWTVGLLVHLTFLTGFGNRILAAFRWSFGLVGRRRSERTITVRQPTARIRELGEIPVDEGSGARIGSSG